jgi:poly(A) polymerase
VRLASFSALDLYFGERPRHVASVLAEASLVDAAKTFESLDFPGSVFADAVWEYGGMTVLFRCVDSLSSIPRSRFPVLDLLYDEGRRVFTDRFGVYPELREPELRRNETGEALSYWEALAYSAVLISRFPFSKPEKPNPPDAPQPLLSAFDQRILLTLILESGSPERGLSYLMDAGFVAAHWPLLASLNDTSHGKEYHPEGNVWEHTLETFQYRKTRDLTLSLALLLHDCGKPLSQKNEGKTFDGHAQIGSIWAARFLSGLGFPQSLTDDVSFLVDQHMLPAFIPKLPVSRTGHVLSSELFPLLLEVYRCDISSTYRGPEGYYDACKAYRAYLRHVKNPFRSSDGKKILHMYVEGFSK